MTRARCFPASSQTKGTDHQARVAEGGLCLSQTTCPSAPPNNRSGGGVTQRRPSKEEGRLCCWRGRAVLCLPAYPL